MERFVIAEGALSEEHGHSDVTECSRASEIGEVTIRPNHACACVNRYDEIVAHRGGDVVEVWQAADRGRLR